MGWVRFFFRWLWLATIVPAAWGQITLPAPVADIKVRPLISVDRLTPGSRFRLAVVLDVAEPWHVNANPASVTGFIPTTLTLDAPASIVFDPVRYPQGRDVAVSWSATPVSLYQGQIVLFAGGRVREDAAPGPLQIAGRLRYQACDDRVCLPPKTLPVVWTTEIAAAGTVPRPLAPEIFGAASAPGDTGTVRTAAGKTGEQPLGPAPVAPNTIAVLIQQRGLLLAFVVVFFAGLALNLTPCVYPMIAITVSYFGGRGEASPGRALGQALAYFSGVVLTYSALGLIAALTGGLFGGLLQSPVVLAGIAALLAALALSMFGLYEIPPPQFLLQKATGLSSKAGLVGVFFLGAMVGVIAAPCLAPILVALLAYVSQRADPWLGWWLFFVLACGLGLPYIVLGTFSGLLARLPKSGVWMVWVKRVFGIGLLGVAVWIVRPLWAPAAPTLGQPFTWEELAQAAAENRPVIIDFSAAWCGPCWEMDRETFADPRVVAESREFVFLRADVTRDESPEVKKIMKEFAIRGVPTIVFIGPNGHEHGALRRTEKVGADEFLKLMAQAMAPAPTNAPAASAPDIPAQLLRPF